MPASKKRPKGKEFLFKDVQMGKVSFSELHRLLEQGYKNHRIDHVSTIVCTCDDHRTSKNHKSFGLYYKDPEESEKGTLHVMAYGRVSKQDADKLQKILKKAMVEDHEGCKEYENKS